MHPPNASQAPAIHLVNSSSLGLTELVKTPSSAPSPAAPIFSMTLGAISNIVALVILVQSYTRFRRRSKATFLLFASSLVITDLAGHIIPGSFVLQLYATQRGWRAMDPSRALCQFFGASMVFFGLCPLFLGFMMAVERCIGITPYFVVITTINIVLIYMIFVSRNSHKALNYEELLFLGVRLASWNQILDPWVYILLRRAVLRKLLALLLRRPDLKTTHSDRWEASSFQSSEVAIRVQPCQGRLFNLLPEMTWIFGTYDADFPQC
uniref:Thromboxane A2 receptor n=1 Tax=Pseudonaja textilis TaxID=8673 RepID=A0A670XYW4_PSETE